MDEQEYPGYVDLLKLKKEHPIYIIAALTLGIDPRYLKIHPAFNHAENQYSYDHIEHVGTCWYCPLKAEQTDIDSYIKEEAKYHPKVPLLSLKDTLGIYKSGPKDDLYHELKQSLISAAKNKEINSQKPENIKEDSWLNCIGEQSSVTTESVKEWFRKHNFKTPFFESPSKSEGVPDYLDRNNDEHPEELALAIEAWQRFSDLDISHPKEYIEKWLEETFCSSKREAEKSVATYVSKDARERIAMVANWRKKGGPKSKGLDKDIYNKALAKNIS